ncbi:MAG TPA: FAD-dependent monooxygenase [Longimicrobiales bacterium]|nr:FAD-dependent monooxygenase [Longimicrobiales bacterium]
MDHQTDVPVAIVGAGPVGLALALGLARHGVGSALLEQNDGTSRTSRAPAIHVRTREVLRQWRIEHEFMELGTLLQPLTMHSVAPGADPLATIDFDVIEEEAHQPGLLVLEQSETERLLLAAVRRTGLCDVRFGTKVTGLVQRPASVTLDCSTRRARRQLTARYVVGCDGAGSFVRDAIGLSFDGLTYRLRPLLADVRVDEAVGLPWPRARTGPGDFAFTVRLRPGLWRIVHLQHAPTSGDGGSDDEVSHTDVAACVHQLLGVRDFELAWGSRFQIHRRSAPAFRAGNVLLAGDAAHVHSPASGQGMNAGIHDAHNLAWKLAAALRDGDDGRLLDSYDVERRSVSVGTTSRYTDLLTRAFIQAPGFVRRLSWKALRGALGSTSLRRRIARRVAMIDLDYPASPLLRAGDRAAGVRLPDVMLHAPDGGRSRLYDLLPAGPVMLDLRARVSRGPASPVLDDGATLPAVAIGANSDWTDRSGSLRRLLGEDDGMLLVRPDTHVAWAHNPSAPFPSAIRFALGGRTDPG